MVSLLFFSALVACAFAGNVYGPYNDGYVAPAVSGYPSVWPVYAGPRALGAVLRSASAVAQASGVGDSISAVPVIGAVPAAPGIVGGSLIRPAPVVPAAPVVSVAGAAAIPAIPAKAGYGYQVW